MQRETFEELCSGYVLGALSTEEALEFERALAVADSESKRFFEGMAFAALHLPLGVEMVAPPSHVKVKILQAILPEPEPEPTLWQRIVAGLGLDRPGLAWSAAFVFLFGVLGSSIYAFKTADDLEATKLQATHYIKLDAKNKTRIKTLTAANTQLGTQLKKARQALKSAQMTIAKQADLIKVMRGEKVQLVAMGAAKKGSKGHGKVIWDPVSQRAVLQLVDLPRPSARVYHLWWIIKKGRKLNPIPAGVVKISETGPDTFHNIDRKYLPVVKRRRRTSGIFAITIEKGPVKAPTAKPVVLGATKIRL